MKDHAITNPLFAQSIQIDRDAKRRRVLAKVYGLLIKLAEEAENQAPLPDIVSEEEGSIVEPTPIQLELMI